ncbi:MAG TPA: MraY family glycosyltransferase [Bdellovibrio sp.]|uniref:MraY family glycosyltransferase n=1 Tax=Bdellovibrio sp. TaxID=28201 RepID=UPI002EDEF6A2
MLLMTICSFVVAFMISVIAIPSIIKVADLKHLMDEPDSTRKLHVKRTPTLGGISIFAATIFSYSAVADFLEIKYEIKMMIPALILLFFAGVKDDILILSPLKKLFTQFICAALITIIGNMRITSLWGMFGITDISPFTGALLTFLVVVSLINAFNLIDGVDGLAGGLGFIASMFFGIWFALTNATASAILSFSLAGSLLGFLFFNYRNAKIFMGDTGSMILGFIISILAIKFIESNRASDIVSSPFYIKAAPGVAIAAVLIPLLDMTRIFFHRVLQGKSPFSADRNHIHHLLIDLGLSPLQVTLCLHFFAIAFIGIGLLLRELRSMNLVLILIVLITLLKSILLFVHKYQICHKKRQPNIIRHNIT